MVQFSYTFIDEIITYESFSIVEQIFESNFFVLLLVHTNQHSNNANCMQCVLGTTDSLPLACSSFIVESHVYVILYTLYTVYSIHCILYTVCYRPSIGGNMNAVHCRRTNQIRLYVCQPMHSTVICVNDSTQYRVCARIALYSIDLRHVSFHL